MEDTYHFFWKGPLSQWVRSPFKAYNIEFVCCEQWMMYQKAILFEDKEIANEILETTNPKIQKDLGRKVRGFDEKVWDEIKYKTVMFGNILKFQQNPEHRKILLSTGDKLLVEASPYDRIWGIGYREEDALANESSWGQNLLGKALVEVREILKREK